jgi:hypothetical protein
MSDDFISGLRSDLVEAAARQRELGRPARAVRPVHPRAWSPTAVLGAVAAAAALLVLVVALRAVGPTPTPTDAKVVGKVQIGGQPRDAVVAGGSLWVADYGGALVRLDLATRKVRARTPLAGTPVSVAADGHFVWVLSVDDGGNRSLLVKLDARTGRIVDRVPVGGWGAAVAAGAGGLWLLPSIHRGDVERIDPTTYRRTAFFPKLADEGLAVSGGSVWARRDDVVVQIDAVSGRVVNRVAGIAPPLDTSSLRTLLPDAEGAWVVGGRDGLLYRVERGRVVRKLTVGQTAGAVARGRSAIWVTASPRPDVYELVRVDPDEGKVTGRVPLGFRVPQTLVPVGKRLWVVTSTGDVLRVSPA